jgi:hypothetical protein
MSENPECLAFYTAMSVFCNFNACLYCKSDFARNIVFVWMKINMISKKPVNGQVLFRRRTGFGRNEICVCLCQNLPVAGIKKGNKKMS